MNGRLLELVFLVGLGGVFLANAAVALVEPDSFEDLVGASFAGRLIDGGDWIGPLVAGNDLLTGVAIIAAHRVARIRGAVLAWAGVWLMAVTVLKLTAMA